MTIWMWGDMTFKTPVPKEIQKDIVEKYGNMFFFDSDGTTLTLDYVLGDYGHEINEIAGFLTDKGYEIEPEESSFPFTGDYEGGYLWCEDSFDSFDTEDFVLRTLPTEALTDELNRRNHRSNPQQN